MQGEERQLDPGPSQELEERRSEVEAGGRRGHRPRRSCVDRLVVGPVGGSRPTLTLDVRRQRGLAESFEPIQVERRTAVEEPLAVPEGLHRCHPSAVGQRQGLPHPDSGRRPQQALPVALVAGPQQQELEPAARGPPGPQPRRDDTGVVEQHEIAG